MNTQPRPSEIVIMISGLVAFLSIFFNWYEGFGEDWNGFGKTVFPFGFYIGLIGLAMGLAVALRLFANVNLPDRVLSFTWPQIHLILAVFAGLLAIGFLLRDDLELDRGIGLWLGLLGSIGLVVGAVMLFTEGERETPASSGPPTPF